MESVLVNFPIAVTKTNKETQTKPTTVTWERKRFTWLTGCSLSLREARTRVKRRRNLKQKPWKSRAYRLAPFELLSFLTELRLRCPEMALLSVPWAFLS